MRNEESKLLFRIKGWIDSDDFKRVLKFADYLGREHGYSLFKLSLDKIYSRNISAEDVILTLDELNAEFDRELENVLKNVGKSKVGKAILSFDGSRIYVRFNRYLGDLYKDRLKDLLKYNHEDKVFYVYPYRYHELISELRSIGFSIEDLTGFKDSLPINSDFRFTGELRDYQDEALKSWRMNNYRGVIALPTGSGKTIIGIKSIEIAGERTLIIAYTKEQLMQWRQMIQKFTTIPEHLIGLYYSKEKRIAPITLATYQTAYKHVLKLAPHFNHLIIDEVHHLPAEKFKRIATLMPCKYRMGLSATPYREDGKHVILFPLMGGVVYYKSPQELADRGYLARYKVITIKVPPTPAERKRYEELRREFRKIAGYVDFNALLEAARRGDPKAIQALRIHSEMRQLVQKSEAKVRKVEEIIKDELSRGSKIIVFAHYVDLANEIARRVGAYLLTGEMDVHKRKLILDRFRSIDKGVLVVTTVGDEGLDIPDANVGILVAGTGSRRQFIQRLGRILRPGNGKEARLYEVVAKGTSEEYQSRRRKKLDLNDFDASTDVNK